jgi:inhibitor of cysteine peptidase
MSTLALTEYDNDSQVDAQVDDEIRVTLEENPSTGYRWTLGSPATPDVIKLRHTEFDAAAGAGVGGGGKRMFILLAIAPGHAALELQLRPAWQPDAAAIQTFRSLVTVR